MERVKTLSVEIIMIEKKRLLAVAGMVKKIILATWKHRQRTGNGKDQIVWLTYEWRKLSISSQQA